MMLYVVVWFLVFWYDIVVILCEWSKWVLDVIFLLLVINILFFLVLIFLFEKKLNVVMFLIVFNFFFLYLDNGLW